mgnify:CR=1 FL=1
MQLCWRECEVKSVEHAILAKDRIFRLSYGTYSGETRSFCKLKLIICTDELFLEEWTSASDLKTLISDMKEFANWIADAFVDPINPHPYR